MSTENETLYELLDSSCEDMLLYFQEVVYHLAEDIEDLRQRLDALFAKVGLTAADEYQKGREVSDEVKEKLAEWKQLAQNTPEYVEFSQKYGPRAVKALLGMSGNFSGNPTGIGADDYPDVIRHVYEGTSAFQRDLECKYPGVSAVVKHLSSNEISSNDFTSISIEVLDKKGDFHLEQPALLDKFSRFLTKKDKESSLNDIMYYQFNVVFSQFIEIFRPAGDIVAKKPNPDRDVASGIESVCRKQEDLVKQNRIDLANASGPVQYKELMSKLESSLAALINISKKNLEQMDAPGSGKSPKERNERALRLAVLEGKKSFEKLVEEEYTIVKVADIVGFNPAKMTVLDRLTAADGIEKLKSEHVGKVIHESITAMKKIMENPKSSTEAFNAASKGVGILQGDDTYQRKTLDKTNADDSISTIPKEDGADCLEKRLEQFRDHYEQNKKFLSEKPIKKLISFVIENLKAFIFSEKPNQTNPQEVKDLDSAQYNQSSSPHLKKRSLSEKSLLSAAPSVGMWPKPIISETEISKASAIAAPPAI